MHDTDKDYGSGSASQERRDEIEGLMQSFKFTENIFWDLPGGTKYEEMKELQLKKRQMDETHRVVRSIKALLHIDQPSLRESEKTALEDANTKTIESIYLKLAKNSPRNKGKSDGEWMESEKRLLRARFSERYLQSTKLRRIADWDIAIERAGLSLSNVKTAIRKFCELHHSMHAMNYEDSQNAFLELLRMRKQIEESILEPAMKEWITIGYTMNEY